MPPLCRGICGKLFSASPQDGSRRLRGSDWTGHGYLSPLPHTTPLLQRKAWELAVLRLLPLQITKIIVPCSPWGYIMMQLRCTLLHSETTLFTMISWCCYFKSRIHKSNEPSWEMWGWVDGLFFQMFLKMSHSKFGLTMCCVNLLHNHWRGTNQVTK